MPSKSPVPRSFSRSATTARQREAIKLLANGVTAKEAGRQLGGITENGVRKLWARALRQQAKEMRTADAYERGLAMVMLRLEALLATWLAKGIAGDKDGADIALRTLALIMRVCGYDDQRSTRPQVGDGGDPATDGPGQPLPAAQLAGVLSRLEDIGNRLATNGQPVIEGEITEHSQPEQESNENTPS
jgi:hypothetical protein